MHGGISGITVLGRAKDVCCVLGIASLKYYFMHFVDGILKCRGLLENWSWLGGILGKLDYPVKIHGQYESEMSYEKRTASYCMVCITGGGGTSIALHMIPGLLDF